MLASPSGIRLTKDAIDKLRSEGYLYFRINGYTLDEHIGLNFLLLTPVIDLPTDFSDMDIYAPLESKLIQDWAKGLQSEMLAYIDESFVR